MKSNRQFSLVQFSSRWNLCTPSLALAGAAATTIFVATSILFSRQKTCFVATNTYLSRQKQACRDKTFVATKYVCRDKITFVATKDVFCVCRDKNDTCGSSRQ